MKKIYLYTFAALIGLMVIIGGTRLASAYDIRSGDNINTSSQKPINDTMFVAGKTVDINNEVFGDVFCAGQNITVTGTIHGDVICAGQTVNVSGVVDGDVRLAGQTVTLGAKVAGNATIGGQSFVTQTGSAIGGDLTVGSTDATLNGSVGRDVVGGGTSIVVNNKVSRHMKIGADKLELGSGARVGGNIDLTSAHDISKNSQAVVSGTVSRTVPKDNESQSNRGAIFGFSIVWFLICLLTMLATAMVLALLFPRLLHTVTQNALPTPWKALLVGFIACIAAPIILITLAATLVGIPLAILFGLAWALLLFLSGPTFAYYLGRLTLRHSTQPLMIMLVGAIILIVLYFIPIIGIIAVLAAMFVGTGTLLLQLAKKMPKPVYSTVGIPTKATQPKPHEQPKED
jgi:hypothetical protein